MLKFIFYFISLNALLTNLGISGEMGTLLSVYKDFGHKHTTDQFHNFIEHYNKNVSSKNLKSDVITKYNKTKSVSYKNFIIANNIKKIPVFNINQSTNSAYMYAGTTRIYTNAQLFFEDKIKVGKNIIPLASTDLSIDEQFNYYSSYIVGSKSKKRLGKILLLDFFVPSAQAAIEEEQLVIAALMEYGVYSGKMKSGDYANNLIALRKMASSFVPGGQCKTAGFHNLYYKNAKKFDLDKVSTYFGGDGINDLSSLTVKNYLVAAREDLGLIIVDQNGYKVESLDNVVEFGGVLGNTEWEKLQDYAFKEHAADQSKINTNKFLSPFVQLLDCIKKQDGVNHKAHVERLKTLSQ